MTCAATLFRHRRALTLCAASALLHAMALWWVAPQLGLAGAAPVDMAPQPIVARLLVAEPAPPGATPPPAARAPARERRAGPPAAAPAGRRRGPAVPDPQAGAADEPSAVQSGVPASVAESPPVASTAPTEPEPVATVAAPVPAPAAAPAAAAALPSYRVAMPPSARIVLDVTRSDADGTQWHGEALMAWQRQGERYHMKVEAGIRLLVARVNLVVLDSEGQVGDAGFAPVTMTERRRGRAQTATHFSARDGRITFSASATAVALLPGAQDKATVPLQLAAIARADSAQLVGGIDLQVGEDRDASVFHFVLLGQEVLATGLGKLQTWHLSRPPRAGAYGSRLDIWLAPERGWLPVQIRNIEASGAVTTQTVNQIDITDAGSGYAD